METKKLFITSRLFTDKFNLELRLANNVVLLSQEQNDVFLDFAQVEELIRTLQEHLKAST